MSIIIITIILTLNNTHINNNTTHNTNNNKVITNIIGFNTHTYYLCHFIIQYLHKQYTHTIIISLHNNTWHTHNTKQNTACTKCNNCHNTHIIIILITIHNNSHTQCQSHTV